jgi:hypothetical protein
MRQGLHSVLWGIMTERYRKGAHRVQYLLAVEGSGILLTANHYFGENVEQW